MKGYCIISVQFICRSSQEIQSSDDDSESRSQLNTSVSPSAFAEQFQPLITAQQETQKQLTALRVELKRFKAAEDSLRGMQIRDWFVAVMLLLLHLIGLYWMVNKRK